MEPVQTRDQSRFSQFSFSVMCGGRIQRKTRDVLDFALKVSMLYGGVLVHKTKDHSPVSPPSALCHNGVWWQFMPKPKASGMNCF